MLKFWKKKPTETASASTGDAQEPQPPEAGTGTDVTAPASGLPELPVALTEIPTPFGTLDEQAPVADTPSAAASAEAPAKRSWRERLAGNAFARGLTTLFVRNPKLDDDLLDELETTLITADTASLQLTQRGQIDLQRMNARVITD
jgi:fused signal recognition particle receptor